MCRCDDFTSATTHFGLSQNYFRQCCHRKLASSCSHALDSGTPMRFMVLGRTTNRSSYSLDPGGFLFLVQTKYKKRTLFLVGNVDGRDLHRVARRCGTGRRCSVSGQQHGHPKIYAFRSELCSSRDHTRPPKLSLALAMVLTMNAQRFQRTHLFRGMWRGSKAALWKCVCGTPSRKNDTPGNTIILIDNMPLALAITKCACGMFCNIAIQAHEIASESNPADALLSAEMA